MTRRSTITSASAKAGLDVAAGQRPLVDPVRAQILVDERRARDRELGIDDSRQRVVLDDHVVDRVGHGVAIVADHHRDRVADMVDLPARQRPVRRITDVDTGRRPGHRQRAGDVGHVLAGEYGLDAGPLRCRGRVDRDDLGVCLRRAHERRPQHRRQCDVVDVAALAGDQRRILLAAHRAADIAGRGRRVSDAHAVTSRDFSAASSTALTML